MASLAHAQEPPLPRRAVAVRILGDTANRNLSAVVNFLRSQTAHEFASRGLTTAPETNADFILSYFLEEVEGRALVRITLADRKDGAIVHAAQRLVFPGLLAQPLLEDSIRNVLEVIQETQVRFVILGSVNYNLVFESPEEGMELWMGRGPGRVLLGKIRDGVLSAPYYPFDKDATLTLSAEKEGRWPREIQVPLGLEPKRVFVDRLNVFSQHQVFVALSPTRMGLRGGYRFFPLPDKFMVGADLSFWIQYPFLPNASPIYHQELRAATGVYLFFPEDHWVRFLAGLATSWFFSYIPSDLAFLASNNFAVEPLWFALEWNQSWYTLFLEARVVNGLGVSDLFPNTYLGLWLSLGGAIKW